MVLEPLSFQVARGAILGLVGPNGAGKTTTLSCLAGLVRPDSGEATWDGVPILDQAGLISLLPESPEVYLLLTVEEHLELAARLFRLGPEWRKDAECVLGRMDLAPYRKKLGAALSNGLRQRVLMASIALRRAPLLLVDEPMIGLDPAGQREIKRLLAEFRDQGAAIVLSSHQLGLIEELADTVLVLSKGRVMAQGTLSELKTGARERLEDWFFRYTEEG